MAELTDLSRTYTLEDFSENGFLDEEKVEDGRLPVEKPESIPVLSLEEAGFSIDTRFEHLVRSGDDDERPRSDKDPRYATRSETVYAVAIIATRNGASREQIAGLLLNPEYRISESVLEKRDPDGYAWRQADKAAGLVAAQWPDTYQSGKPRSSYHNALVGLSRLVVNFEYDEFQNRKRIGGHALNDFQGDLTDDVAAMLRRLFLNVHGFDPGKSHLFDALQTLCLEGRFHLIRRYLETLTWDRTERLDTFFIRYMGAEDNALNRYLGRMMFAAAVGQRCLSWPSPCPLSQGDGLRGLARADRAGLVWNSNRKFLF